MGVSHCRRDSSEAAAASVRWREPGRRQRDSPWASSLIERAPVLVNRHSLGRTILAAKTQALCKQTHSDNAGTGGRARERPHTAGPLGEPRQPLALRGCVPGAVGTVRPRQPPRPALGSATTPPSAPREAPLRGSPASAAAHTPVPALGGVRRRLCLSGGLSGGRGSVHAHTPPGSSCPEGRGRGLGRRGFSQLCVHARRTALVSWAACVKAETRCAGNLLPHAEPEGRTPGAARL